MEFSSIVPVVFIFSGLFHSNKLIYHKNVPLLSLSDHNKVGHDQFFCKKKYTKLLVQDRHFFPKCNAWSKMPILLSEGKIIKNWFWRHKTECFVASRAFSFERKFLWNGWWYCDKSSNDCFTVNNMLFSCCLPVINMFLTVYYMFFTVKINDAVAPFITYERIFGD